jgi:hypothetical protein
MFLRASRIRFELIETARPVSVVEVVTGARFSRRREWKLRRRSDVRASLIYQSVQLPSNCASWQTSLVIEQSGSVTRKRGQVMGVCSFACFERRETTHSSAALFNPAKGAH